MGKNLTKKEIKHLSESIEVEGFDYCFIDYADFDEIKNDEFQEKLKAFRESRQIFVDFLESQGVEVYS